MNIHWWITFFVALAACEEAISVVKQDNTEEQENFYPSSLNRSKRSDPLRPLRPVQIYRPDLLSFQDIAHITLEKGFKMFQTKETTKTPRRCEVDIDDLDKNQPLYISTYDTWTFHYPHGGDGIMRFNEGERLELNCVDQFFESPLMLSNYKSAIIKCVQGTIFDLGGIHLSITQFKCKNWPKPTLIKTDLQCYNRANIIHTGFQVDERWFHMYTSCHDTIIEQNYYSSHIITPIAVGGASRSSGLGSWSQDNFYPGKNVYTLYRKDKVLETITRILRSSYLAGEIVKVGDNTQHYLARGHLAANADFVFANEQRATFYFTNAAPQFQTFNNGNWKYLENDVRQLAADRDIKLEVYTGTFEIEQFKDRDNVLTSIYLDYHLDPNNDGASIRLIPVPKVFYKVLVNPLNRQGVAFVGVNNPYLESDELRPQGYRVCNTNLIRTITYITFDPDHQKSGYIEACAVSDFLLKVPHLTNVIGPIWGLLN